MNKTQETKKNPEVTTPKPDGWAIIRDKVVGCYFECVDGLTWKYMVGGV